MQLAVGFSFSACFWVQKNFFSPKNGPNWQDSGKKKEKKTLDFYNWFESVTKCAGCIIIIYYLFIYLLFIFPNFAM